MKPALRHETNDCRMISDMLARVGDKWSMLIVSYLGEGPKRFSELKRIVGGISQKMLTSTLRNLERDGMVLRTVEPTRPPSVTYELTELGQEMLVPVSALEIWTRDNIGRIEAARTKFDKS